MPYRSMNVPPVDIWGGYNQSLETIGQGIANYITEQRRLKEAKRLEEETYQKQRKREEEEYQKALKRKEELEQGTIGRAYKGLLSLKRPEIYDESGEQIASPAPMRGVPTNLPADVYTKMMETELVKQGLLPGVKNEFSLADGYRLNKDTGEFIKLPGWTPKTDYKEREKPIKGGLFIKEYSNDGGLTWNAVPNSVPYQKKEGTEGKQDNTDWDNFMSGMKTLADMQLDNDNGAEQFKNLLKTRYPKFWAMMNPPKVEDETVTPEEKTGTVGGWWRSLWGNKTLSDKMSIPQGMPSDARKAPDGKWYVPDPKRPGKYLRVD